MAVFLMAVCRCSGYVLGIILSDYIKPQENISKTDCDTVNICFVLTNILIS